MHNIVVNNKSMQVTLDCNLIQLIAVAGFADQAIAVAINGEFVPRGNYQQTAIANNDAIDIVTPIGGG